MREGECEGGRSLLRGLTSLPPGLFEEGFLSYDQVDVGMQYSTASGEDSFF